MVGGRYLLPDFRWRRSSTGVFFPDGENQQNSDEYRKLQARVDDLRRLSDGHKFWPEAREKFALFSKEEDYLAASKRLNGALREVRESLPSKE